MEKTFVVCHMFVSMDGKIDRASSPAVFSLLEAKKLEGGRAWAAL